MTERRLKRQKILRFHGTESGTVSPVSVQKMWEEEKYSPKGLWLEKVERVGGLETPFAIVHFPFKAIVFMRNSLQGS